MKGVLAVNRLKDVNNVKVFMGKQSQHFNRIPIDGGLWHNYVKCELLSDEDMDKVFQAYEFAGWGIILYKDEVQQAVEHTDSALYAGEYLIPENAFKVVALTHTGKEIKFLKDSTINKFLSPYNSYTLEDFRIMILSCLLSGSYVLVDVYDTSDKIIKTSKEYNQ